MTLLFWKVYAKEKKCLGHDLHHVVFWKAFPNHKGLQQDLNNPENQEAATFLCGMVQILKPAW